MIRPALISLMSGGGGAAAAPDEQVILQNESGLAKFYDLLMRTDSSTQATPATIGITGFADSMPGAFTARFVMDMSEKVGFAALASPEFGTSWNGAAATMTGGAAVASSDYTISPAANTITIPAGGKYALTTPNIGSNPSLAIWTGGGAVSDEAISLGRLAISLPHGITKVSVYYVVESGAGNITGTLIQSQLANVTSTVSANGATGLGVMDLIPGDAYGAITVEVTAATATVKMLGILFWTGQSGLFHWTSAKGSTEMNTQLPGLSSGAWNTVYAALFANLNTGLVVHAQRATSPGTEADNYQANYATFFGAYSALNASQLVLAEPSREPLAENPLTTDTVNNFLRTESKSRGLCFYDRKKLVPNPSPFKLGVTDGIHRDPREHRYTVGWLVNRIGSFRASYSRQNGLSLGRIADQRFRLGALSRCRTRDFIGQGGYTYFSTTHSGAPYANATCTNDTGFNLVSVAATIGHSSACYGQMIASGSQFDTTLGDIVVSAQGYRNLSLPAGGGHRAALVFGTSSTSVTDITALAVRCFGIEFGHGTDIGGGLAAVEYMRIFAHNGTSMTYSPWVVLTTGSGVVSGTGLAVMLHWDFARQRFVLWGNGGNADLHPRVSLGVPALASNATSAAFVHGYIRATGTGHTAGKMQWTHLSCSFGTLNVPYRM